MATPQSSSSPSLIDDAGRLVPTLLLTAYVLVPAVLVIVSVTVLYQHLLRRTSRSPVDRSGNKILGSVGSGGSSPDSGSGPLLDVWAERQKRGIGPSTTQSTARSGQGGKSPGDKPFGSKYYYAHNNPNSTGGYKDGLRMEDYTMNGPRLLARNGVAMPPRTDSAEGADMADAITSDAFDGPATIEQDARVQSVKRARKRIVPVTQYLWDDTGKGIGTIRVDHLPHPTKPGEKRSWRDSEVGSVRACLVSDDCGLEVVMETYVGASSGDIEYRLFIPKLYGPVSAVNTVTKPSRLLIKLEKRTTFLDKSNAKPWPHPQKKLL